MEMDAIDDLMPQHTLATKPDFGVAQTNLTTVGKTVLQAGDRWTFQIAEHLIWPVEKEWDVGREKCESRIASK